MGIFFLSIQQAVLSIFLGKQRLALSDKIERFVSLLTANQFRIFGFIHSLVHIRADAEDIMQDTSTIMWSKFDDYRAGTDFTAWGVKIAKYRISEYFKKKKPYTLSHETLSLLADESVKILPELERREEALSYCIEKLRLRDKKLIQWRYTYSYNAKAIANRMGTTVGMVYRHMCRIKRLLIDCMHKQLKTQEI